MSGAAPKSIGFQWERYEAWRHHPLLRFDKKNLFPGFSAGVALYIGYLVSQQPALRAIFGLAVALMQRHGRSPVTEQRMMCLEHAGIQESKPKR